MELIKKVNDDETEVIIKQSDLFLKGGRRVRIWDKGIIKKSDISGIILKSGKIISLNHYITPFSENRLSDYPSPKFITNIDKARQDMEGFDNTNILALNCYESGLSLLDKLEDNEYIPSVGELLEVFSEFDRINQIRKAIGLEPLPVGYYWSSTIRNNETMWIVRSDGGTDWGHWCNYYRLSSYVLAFLRE